MDVLVMMLIYLPIALPLGLCGYGAARWGWRQEREPLRKLLRVLLVLGLIALGVSIVYGVLRFSGTVLKPEELDWMGSGRNFDTRWQDDGFVHFYWCGVPLLGALIGIFREEKRSRARAGL